MRENILTFIWHPPTTDLTLENAFFPFHWAFNPGLGHTLFSSSTVTLNFVNQAQKHKVQMLMLSAFTTKSQSKKEHTGAELQTKATINKM